MNSDLWIILIALGSAFLPWIILRFYHAELIPAELARMFDIFWWMEVLWGLFVCLFILLWLREKSAMNYLIALAIIAASICMPSAMMALITGIYPINRGYSLYRCYQAPKPSYRKNILLTRLPILRMMGLLQLILLAGAVGLFLFRL